MESIFLSLKGKKKKTSIEIVRKESIFFVSREKKQKDINVEIVKQPHKCLFFTKISHQLLYHFIYKIENIFY